MLGPGKTKVRIDARVSGRWRPCGKRPPCPWRRRILGPHPLHFLRQRLQAEGYRPIAELLRAPAGGGKGVAGLVTHRQRPATAHGTVFLTLEDESGRINVIVWPSQVEPWRRAILQGRLLGVRGKLERDGRVCHLIAQSLTDYSQWLGELATRSRDFC